jgi:hypothetical protein
LLLPLDFKARFLYSWRKTWKVVKGRGFSFPGATLHEKKTAATLDLIADIGMAAPTWNTFTPTQSGGFRTRVGNEIAAAERRFSTIP